MPNNLEVGGNTAGTNTVIGGSTEVVTPNASVLILASHDDAGAVEALQQYFSKASIVWFSMLSKNSSINLGVDALIIASGSNATLSNPKVMLIAKQFLSEGKTLVIVNNAKPVSKATLLHFLREAGVKGVTFDNVKSAIYEKNLDGKKDYIYVFSLRLSEGKYPSMHILDAEEGARISADYVYNYVVQSVAGSLN